MARIELPLFAPVYKGIGREEIFDKDGLLINGFIDSKKNLVRRPGATNPEGGAYMYMPLSYGQNCLGLFWWDRRTSLIAAFENVILKIKMSQGFADYEYLGFLTAAGGVKFLTGNRQATFATDGTRVLMANNSPIVYVTTDQSSATIIADADAPTRVTHLAFLDGYILANQLSTSTFYWCDVGDYSSWSALSFATAEADPDTIQALHVWNRQVYIFGRQTIEIWENDGSTPFIRIPGGVLQVGLHAPYSVVKLPDAMYWLAQLPGGLRFVEYSRGGLKIMDSPYDEEINEMGVRDFVGQQGDDGDDKSPCFDCSAYPLSVYGNDLVVFTFFQLNKTFVYNRTTDTWSQWGIGDVPSSLIEDGVEFTRSSWQIDCFPYTQAAYCPQFGQQTFLAMQGVPAIDKLTYAEVGKVPMIKRTGHLDYGTLAKKRSRKVSLLLKSGTPAQEYNANYPAVSLNCVLRWRDDGGAWSNERFISLRPNESGIVDIDTPGIFTTRQYEITCTDPVFFIGGKAEEDLEVLQ